MPHASRSALITEFRCLCYAAAPTNYLAHGSVYRGFPGGSEGRESSYNAGDPGSTPGSERSPGEVSVSQRHSSNLSRPLPPRLRPKSSLYICISTVGLLSRFSHVGLCAILWTAACPWLLCPWNSPGKNTGVGSHSLLQGIFPTQGSNLGLTHCRQIFFFLPSEPLEKSHHLSIRRVIIVTQ